MLSAVDHERNRLDGIIVYIVWFKYQEACFVACEIQILNLFLTL